MIAGRASACDSACSSRASALAAVFAATLAGAGSGCNPFPDFPSDSIVDSVRILAVRADKPYASPGAVVRFDVLAVDGRAQKPAPMRVFWVPIPCTLRLQPPDVCYPTFAGLFQPGADLSHDLHEGDSLSALVPIDQSTGEGSPYNGPVQVRMNVFVMACAGHVEYIGARGAVPFGCFDEAGAELGGHDFMFAVAHVGVLEGVTNQNPAIDGLELDSEPVDPAAGITLPRCTAKEGVDCPVRPLTLLVPTSSQEVLPAASGSAGASGEGGGSGGGGGAGGGTVSTTSTGAARPIKEVLSASFYSTLGETRGAALLPYDPESGKKPFPTSAYSAPRTAGEGALFAVVRDSRDGVNWLQVPLHVQ